MTGIWLPYADRMPEPDNGAFTGGPRKGVLHTTESRGWASYQPGTKPNLEICPDFVKRDVNVRQYYPLDMPSRALQDGPDPVRTNRDGVVNIELVGTTSYSGWGDYYVPNWPDWYYAGIARVMRDVERLTKTLTQQGISPSSPFTFKAGEARMSPAAWDKFGAWCGHMHVPENDHTDPHGIAIAKLLPKETTEDMATVNQQDWDALIWRVEALVNGRETVANGPTKGEAVKVIQELNAIKAKIGA